MNYMSENGPTVTPPNESAPLEKGLRLAMRKFAARMRLLFFKEKLIEKELTELEKEERTRREEEQKLHLKNKIEHL